MSALVVVLRSWLVRAGFRLGCLRPMRRRVLFATAHADRIGGNLAFIRDELARRRLPVEVAVQAHRARGGAMGRLSGALAAFRAGWALARARVVVIDDYHFAVYVIRPRAGSTIVQTWHASGAFKKFGHSASGHSFGADAVLRRRVRIHANYDLALVGSRASAPAFAEAFGMPADRIISSIGIPRTDLLLDPARRERARDGVSHRLRLPAGKRIILYAPTFRGDRITQARHRDDLDLVRLAATLGDDHVLLLRMHPFVSRAARIGPGAASFVIDASAEPDVNALMLVSDVLVTDYSSAIFEFSLLGRPMAFFAPDLAEYERDRGLYVDYRAWVPGPVFDDTDALAAWIRSGEADLDRVRDFARRSFEIADGRASARFVDRVVLPALGLEPGR